MASVELQRIRKRYPDGNEVIKGVDLKIEHGEFMVFVGPSGCGKSTLLRMVAGLEEISGGELRIDQHRCNIVPASKRSVAMVFQNYALYPHMNVAENMGFALKLAGMTRDDIGRRVGEAARVLRLESLLERRPAQLSGGQRQRVAIGRAIVRNPGVFLFDEPLSNLDAALRVQMRLEIARLHQELRNTMIYVTHDQMEAMTLGDRIAVFNEGRIEQVGGPLDLYERPQNLFVAGFIGSPKMNLIAAQRDGDVLRFGANCLPLASTDPLPAGACHLGIRPEHLTLAEPGDVGFDARIALIEQLGDSTLLHFLLDGVEATQTARLPGIERRLAPGQNIRLAPLPDALHLFDGAGQRITSHGERVH